MSAEITSRIKKLNIGKTPERNFANLTLYPAGSKIPTYIQRVNEEKQHIQLDSNKVGPKPICIEKFNKVVKKIRKNKVRGGKRSKIEKNVKQLKQILNNCTTEEEKNRFYVLLVKAKNDLNRLRKNKPIKIVN